MTKKEMFSAIANVAEVAANAEMVEFLNHQIELLDARKSAPKTPTKTQKENEVLMANIEADLIRIGDRVTVSELITNCEDLKGLSNQKVSALLRKMVEDKKVVKTIEKKKAYFSVA